MKPFSIQIFHEFYDLLLGLIDFEFLILIHDEVTVSDINTMRLPEIEEIVGLISIVAKEQYL